MEFLCSYFENGVVSEEEKAKNYPVILFNLENWYGLRGQDDDYKKALELSEIAIDMCIRFGILTGFPYHLYNKGCALVKLGKISEGKKYLQQAYNVFESMKEFGEIEHAKKWVNENLGINF